MVLPSWLFLDQSPTILCKAAMREARLSDISACPDEGPCTRKVVQRPCTHPWSSTIGYRRRTFGIGLQVLIKRISGPNCCKTIANLGLSSIRKLVQRFGLFTDTESKSSCLRARLAHFSVFCPCMCRYSTRVCSRVMYDTKAMCL